MSDQHFWGTLVKVQTEKFCIAENWSCNYIIYIAIMYMLLAGDVVWTCLMH